MINQILVDFIPGLVFGIEIFMGEDLEDGDKFACIINIGIFRFTYVLSEKE